MHSIRWGIAALVLVARRTGHGIEQTEIAVHWLKAIRRGFLQIPEEPTQHGRRRRNHRIDRALQANTRKTA